MRNALRSEWIKLRTARSNLVLLLLAVLIPPGLALLVTLAGDFEFTDGADTFAGAVLFPTQVAVYLSGAVGALAIGQEYRHNTIRLAFTGEPVRGRVLAAKVVVTTIMGLAIGLVSGLLCLAVGTVVLGAKDVAFGLSNGSENGVAFVGVVILSGLFTLCGFGLGAIMRTPAGAIPALMVWPLIPEPLIAALAPGVGKWFPFNAGGQLANNGVADGGVEAVSRLTGGLVFGGFVALVVTAGWILVERRDA